MKMYFKRDNCLVEVYKFFENKTVLIFSPSVASRQKGNGWIVVKLSQLIPTEYINEYNSDFMSKTERNKIKKRLTLSYAEWTCTDGKIYNNCDEAIEHEKEIMENA